MRKGLAKLTAFVLIASLVLSGGSKDAAAAKKVRLNKKKVRLNVEGTRLQSGGEDEKTDAYRTGCVCGSWRGAGGHTIRRHTRYWYAASQCADAEAADDLSSELAKPVRRCV